MWIYLPATFSNNRHPAVVQPGHEFFRSYGSISMLMEILDNLRENITEYIETRLNILKLKAIDAAGKALSGIITAVLAALLGFFFIFFLSFSGAYGISQATGMPFLGFLCIAGFYLILLIVVVALKDKIIKGPVVKSLMNAFYHKYNKTEKKNAEKVRMNGKSG
jgi:glycerol-3-phosphate acyltransferase PlsY